MRRLLLITLCLACAGCGSSEVDELVMRLKTRDATELREIRSKLVRLPNAIAVPALRKGLHADKWRTRYMSAQLLGRFQAQEAIPELLAALHDSIGGVRVQAAGALGRLQAQGAVPALIDLLDEDAEVVQIAALEALGAIGSSQALPALCRLTQSEPLGVRGAAISVLGPCHDFEGAPVLSAKALQYTRQALDDVFIRIRIAGIVSLRGFSYQGAVADLLRLAQDASPEVQHVAVQSLGEITSSRHAAWQDHPGPDMSLITSALDSIRTATDNAAVRERALQSLAKIAAGTG